MAHLHIDTKEYFLPDPCVVDIKSTDGELFARLWIRNNRADIIGAIDMGTNDTTRLIPIDKLQERLLEMI